jgi:hypothetical protein
MMGSRCCGSSATVVRTPLRTPGLHEKFALI